MPLSSTLLQSTALADSLPAGDLRRRLELNFGRLHDAEFSFEYAITAFTAREAPGDWLGRTLLGLTLDAQALDRESARTEETVRRWPEACNARGYIGVIHPTGRADENQVGGHNAMLRGLCEYYLWKKDPRALAAIRGIINHLMLPTRPLYGAYPDHLLDELMGGPVSGLTVAHDGVWLGLSTDIGTLFFTLDGLTQAYLIDPTPELRALIETMIARYAELDIIKLSAQTHATLTALRGILRWHLEVDARPEYLKIVIDRFQLYLDQARTEHHANFNWFGRPDWTESCAIIDSFMLGAQLWQVTRDPMYIAEAHRIYHNAICHHQRPNGGFGCDFCTGSNGDRFVHAFKWFEAPWCCSMRGAEGLSCAARYAAFTDPAAPRDVWFPFYFEGAVTVRAPGGELSLSVTGEYPYGGKISYQVKKASAPDSATAGWRLHFFVPPGVDAKSFVVKKGETALASKLENGFVVVETPLAADDVIAVEFAITLVAESAKYPTNFPDARHFMHGPLLLGAETATAVPMPALADLSYLGAGRYQCKRTSMLITPIDGLTYLPEAVARTRVLQAVFSGDFPMTPSMMQNPLGQLPFQAGAVTRMINAENPTGDKGGAAKWDPNPDDPFLAHSGAAQHLGRGWKVRPFISVKAGETATLAEIKGPGCINQFWITASAEQFRTLVLRMYWDHEKTPSVEAPLGDFFAMGFDTQPHQVTSMPVVVAPHRGCGCYWQMPFRKHARITLTNDDKKDVRIVAFKVLYKLHAIPAGAAYLHVQWRRSLTTRENPEHTILDGVKGKGLYVGTYLAWTALSRGWWGEGEVKFYLDGDQEFPTICDNGTEDYFGGAWGFFRHPQKDQVEQPFNAPFVGMPLAHTGSADGPRYFGLYRWHIFDSIGFAKDLKVTVQTLGWWPGHIYQPLTEDVASTAFWYQNEPHVAFPKFPTLNERWQR